MSVLPASCRGRRPSAGTELIDVPPPRTPFGALSIEVPKRWTTEEILAVVHPRYRINVSRLDVPDNLETTLSRKIAEIATWPAFRMGERNELRVAGYRGVGLDYVWSDGGERRVGVYLLFVREGFTYVVDGTAAENDRAPLRAAFDRLVRSIEVDAPAS